MVETKNDRIIICPILFDESLIVHSMNIIIDGEPIGKGRPRVTNRGSFAHAYTPKRTKNYEKQVQQSYFNQIGVGTKLEGPIKTEVKAFFPIPKSSTKKQRELMLKDKIKHIHKPDLDNVYKSVFDALNGLAYNDDSQIIIMNGRKYYSDEPRVEIHLEEIK